MAGPVSGGGWSVRIAIFGRQMQADLEGTDADIRAMLGLEETVTATSDVGRRALQEYGENLQKFVEAQVVENAELRQTLEREAHLDPARGLASPEDLKAAAEGLEGALVSRDEIQLPTTTRAIQWVDLSATGALTGHSLEVARRVAELVTRLDPQLGDWRRDHPVWRPGSQALVEADVLSLAHRRALRPSEGVADAGAASPPGGDRVGELERVVRRGIEKPPGSNSCFLISALQLLFEVPGLEGLLRAIPEGDDRFELAKDILSLRQAARGGRMEASEQLGRLREFLHNRDAGAFPQNREADAGEALRHFVDMLSAPAPEDLPLAYLYASGNELVEPQDLRTNVRSVVVQQNRPPALRTFEESRMRFHRTDGSEVEGCPVAVTCHAGGHYVTLIRQDEGWWLLDDASSRRASSDDLSRYSNGVTAVLYDVPLQAEPADAGDLEF